MAAVIEAVLLFGELLAAAAGADDDANLAQFVAGHVFGLDTCVHKRFLHSRQSQRDGARYMRPVFGIDVVVLVEIHHFPRHLYGMVRRIETADAANAAQALARGAPEILAAHAIRADCSTTRRVIFRISITIRRHPRDPLPIRICDSVRGPATWRTYFAFTCPSV